MGKGSRDRRMGRGDKANCGFACACADGQLLEDGEVRSIPLARQTKEDFRLCLIANTLLLSSQLMRWFANEEVRFSFSGPYGDWRQRYAELIARSVPQMPAQPDNFLDAFYLSRDDGGVVRPTA
jgi:hypothetical protein